ncbi:hypothetical protein LMBV_003 [Largemouth bass virus]|uniref:Uncharacterized protein n=1 Tax=Largemouth bass virus TaxID=176656 RepID=A0A9X7TVR1_9VIRU|nr:hypothetical protein OA88_22990 [Flavobacterium sp. JRM]QJE49066.1 hypothetical protein LMBV_003 [Largemouth bass virus]QJE49152.1 hypothetical protein LMBV_003 [Largemouth bass virus]
MSSLVFLNQPVYQMSNILLVDRQLVPQDRGGDPNQDGLMVVAMSAANFTDIIGSAVLNIQRDMVVVGVRHLQQASVLFDMLTVLPAIFGENVAVDMEGFGPELTDAVVAAGFVAVDKLHNTASWKSGVSCPAAKLAVRNAKRVLNGLPCTMTIVVDGVSQKILRDLVELPVEMSGDLQVMTFSDDPKAQQPAIGVAIFDSGSVAKGEAETVAAPTGIVSFHTHPSVATTRHALFYSWPSNMDMAGLMFMQNLMHLVVSVDGMWTMSRSVEMQKVTKLLSEQEKNMVRSTALDLFQVLNDLRTDRPVEEQKRSIAAFYNTFENFTIRQLLQHSRVTPSVFMEEEWLDGKIYVMGLMPWGSEMRFDIQYEVDPTNVFTEVIPSLMPITRKAAIQQVFDNMVSRMTH